MSVFTESCILNLQNQHRASHAGAALGLHMGGGGVVPATYLCPGRLPCASWPQRLTEAGPDLATGKEAYASMCVTDLALKTFHFVSKGMKTGRRLK